MPNVDVVIPTHDTAELTVRCVESVLASELPAGAVHCIVVDNASSDGTAERLAGRPNVTVLRNDENVAFGRACNQGVRAGSGDLVLLLNSDVVASHVALATLSAFLESDSRFVAAGGRLVDPGTDTVQRGFTLRAYPRLSTQMALLVGLERLWPSNPVSRRQLMLDFDYERSQTVDAQPAGACLMCRRVDFEAIGGFDERFYYWFEDVDLVRRLSARGAIGYVHDAVFEHLGAGTFRQWSRPELVEVRYRSLLRYFAKHHPGGETVALRALVALLAAGRAVVLWPVDRPLSQAYARVVSLSLRGDQE
jgi:N-acetylglucosaminyl-diphospho-decaprenol L-rhamnosyltransferase